MLIIAENLNTRNTRYMGAVKKADRSAIETLAEEVAQKKPGMINIQCSLDGVGDETTLPMVTEAVVGATGLNVCLDSRNTEALEKALAFCKQPPLINYLSADEQNADDILGLVSSHRTSLVLRALRGAVPLTLEAKLMILEELIEKANAADIPNERLFADPSVVHIGRGMGQDHLLNTHRCLTTLNDMVEPAINTVVWVSNISVGMPRSLRSQVNAAFLLYLAGAELSAAMMDVIDPAMTQAVYLVRSFRDELIFSPADMQSIKTTVQE